MAGTLSFKTSRFPDHGESSFDKEVNLSFAKIGQDLILKDAKFQDQVKMNEISVGSSLHIGESIFDKTVRLNGAKIGGDVYLTGNYFKKRIEMPGINVLNFLVFKGGRFSGDIDISISNIGVILYDGADSEMLDMTGTQVKRLIVNGERNEKWPKMLNLNNFTYDHFSIFIMEKVLTKRYEGLYVAWMSRLKNYSPQPYEQAAAVLRQSGDPELANTILYVQKERERDEALNEDNVWKWFLLTSLKYTIGYGYYYMRGLWWIIFIIGIGTLVISATPQGRTIGVEQRIIFSFDKLVPIIELSKKTEEMALTRWQANYFTFHKLMGYLIVPLYGFVSSLGS